MKNEHHVRIRCRIIWQYYLDMCIDGINRTPDGTVVGGARDKEGVWRDSLMNQEASLRQLKEHDEMINTLLNSNNKSDLRLLRREMNDLYESLDPRRQKSIEELVVAELGDTSK